MTKRASKTVARKVMNLFFSVFTMLLFCLIIINLIFPNGLLDVVGFGLYRVKTDSMEPTLMVNDFIVAQKVKVDDLQSDDIIIFETKVQLGPAPITQTIVVIHYFGYKDDAGYIYTYNQANFYIEASDPLKYDVWGTESTPYYVTSSDLIGRHRRTIHTASLIGDTVQFFKTPWPYVALSGIGAVIATSVHLGKNKRAHREKDS